MPAHQGIGLVSSVGPVNNIVFDVGRVLIDFTYDDFFALLRKRGGLIRDEADFSGKVDLIAYEHGRISSADFIVRVSSLLTEPLPESELIAAWNGLFTPIDDMLNLARQLRSRCGVYLFSNTSEIHWSHLQAHYDLHSVCHGLLASFEIGAMKPDARAFAAAQQYFGLEPKSTLFVDDKIENVSGALACGWKAFQHRDTAETMMRIQKLTEKND